MQSDNTTNRRDSVRTTNWRR